MADDQKPQPVQDSPSALPTSASNSDQPSPPSTEQATPEATLPPDTQRPESSEMADETMSQTKEATSSAESHQPDSSLPIQAGDSADDTQSSPSVPPESQPPHDTTSAEGVSPPSSPASQDQPSQGSSSSQPLPSPSISPPPLDTQRPFPSVLSDEKLAAERPSEPQPQDQHLESPAPIAEVDKMTDRPPITPDSNLSNLNDISISPGDQQTPQVQSEQSNDASKNRLEQEASSSAEIKPEPLEEPQEAPLADNKPKNSSQKSFGDLLSGNASPISQPVSEQTTPGAALDDSPGVKEPEASSPSVSFGDLLNKPSSDSPPAPPPSPQVIKKIVEKPVEVIKEIPVVDEEEIKRQVEERLKREGKSKYTHYHL